jgi:glycosyltransferase EpsJ
MNPKQPQVTVIMPAYNVDWCVRRAVECLLNQSLRDFELLIVDGGSTDRTGQMLDSMAERDYRISVYHLVHVGAAEARNYALDHARGRYVYFAEADDWAEPTMLEDMVQLAEDSLLDLVMSGYYIDALFGDERIATDLEKVTALSREKDEISAELETCYAKWEELTSSEPL